MDDKREFKINLRAGNPDDDLNSTVAFGKQAKQSTKASILFVLLAFIVFGGILFFLYYNLNSKIQTINTRGSAGIASLSNELNDKLTDFSQQFSGQQETTRALLSDLESQLKKLNSSVSAIQSSKLDKKDLDSTIKWIQDDLAPLQKSIKQFDEQLTGIHDETKRLTVSLNKVQTGVLNNKKEISTLDAIHIDRDYFDQEVKKEREFNQQNMAHASEALFSEIATLHKLIKDIEKKMGDTGMSPDQKQNSSSNVPAKTKSPSDNISVPKPGEIIEQEIK